MTDAPAMIVLRLPVPPSVNALFYNRSVRAGKNGKHLTGRGITTQYRAWLKAADGWYMMQKRAIKPVRGPCEIRIKIPPNKRADPSNKIKAAEDFLVSREITGDDRNNHKISIEVDATVDCCEVTIIPLDSVPHNGL